MSFYCISIVYLLHLKLSPFQSCPGKYCLDYQEKYNDDDSTTLWATSSSAQSPSQ